MLYRSDTSPYTPNIQSGSEGQLSEERFGRYFESLFGEEDSTLREMREAAAGKGIPSIEVPPDVGRLLAILIAATGVSDVLEIGTLFGYSSILMARALPANGHITTLEVSSKHAETARSNFQRLGLADRVTVLEGDALDSLRKLASKSFELVFIDADKPNYPSYLEAVIPLTHTGSLIVADNVWRDGSVADPQDEGTEGLAEFNRKMASDSRLMSALVLNREGADAASVSVVR
jgi:caffeoyl-CoA O-methyltransferase